MSVRRADSCSNVHGSTRVTGSRSAAPSMSTPRQIEVDRRDDFARPQHLHFVGERLQTRRTRIFRAGKLARRQIEQRSADHGV